jgi:prepilin-type N-terminal cleavage/methylation domain-containing protein
MNIAMRSKLKNKNEISSGFTITELLIVVVVIAILASITIVSYRGISNRAYDAAVSSDLSTLAKKIEMFKAANSKFPLTGTEFESLQYNASKSAYQTTSTNYNLLYCKLDGSLGQKYSVVALSKSGNIFRVSSLIPTVESYSGSWSPAAETMCSSLGADDGQATANNRGYASDDQVTGPWRAWTGSSQ